MQSLFSALKYLTPLFALALAVVGFSYYQPPWLVLNIAKVVACGIATFLAAGPLLACFVQTISVNRQNDKLDGAVIDALKTTQYFLIAKANLDSIKPASVTEPDYQLPILLFCITTAIASLLSFMALFWPQYLQTPIFLLDGLHRPESNLDAAGRLADIADFQSGTLVACGVAFMGAYVALFNRLLNQLNNNDIYPISFHYFSAWIVTAMVLAAIYRLVMDLFGFGAIASTITILVSFAIGAIPAPFFAALLHMAANRFNIAADKQDPDKTRMPTNLSLLMIDGLANDKIDRLSEIGVTDALILSCQNPISLWARLPYDLALIVNWISQAQLYFFLRENGLAIVRAQGITDIHKFVAVLSDDQPRKDICAALVLNVAYVEPLLQSLEKDPAYTRLREVKLAMLAPPCLR